MGTPSIPYHLIAYLLCLVAVTWTSLVLERILRVDGLVCRLLGVAILNCAQIVMAIEILSLLRAITAVNLLLLHLGVLSVTVLCCGLKPETIISAAPLRQHLKEISSTGGRELWILAVCVALGGLTVFLLAVALPPNNYDSMTYHLTRVGVYMQQRSLESFPTPCLRQTVYPANAEILILWQDVLLRCDRGSSIVQWLCWCGCIAAVFGIARQLGVRPAAAVFAALAFASLPEVILESSTTQNDLVVTFFLLSAFLFVGGLAKGVEARGSMVATGLALGLAVGTKATAWFALPGVAVYILAEKPAIPWRKVVAVAVALTVGFLLCGSFFYIQNLHKYGSLSGPASIRDLNMLSRIEPMVVWSNLGRLGLQFLNPAGTIPPWGPLSGLISRYYTSLTDVAFAWLHIRKEIPGQDFPGASWKDVPILAVHEDVSSFGVLFGYFGLPVLVFTLIGPRYGVAAAKSRAIAIAATCYLILIAALFRWEVWEGRYLIPMVAVASPLLARLYREKRDWVGRFSNVALVSICLMSVMTSCLMNKMKPIVGKPSIWGKDRLEIMSLGKPQALTLFRLADSIQGDDQRVGVVPASNDDMIYPLFGENFERIIIPILIDREELLDPTNLPKVDYLLVGGESQVFELAGKSKYATGPWFGRTDLHPLLDRLRNDCFGWQKVLDFDGIGHMFARKGLRIKAAPLDDLPEIIFGKGDRWPDLWVGKNITILVRASSARATLLIEGEASKLAAGRQALEVVRPNKESIAKMKLQHPGPFVWRVSLSSLAAVSQDSYDAVEIRSNESFNLMKLGLSNDSRDLSWKLQDLRVTSDPPDRAEPPDFQFVSTWWSDKWVEDRFEVKVRVAPETQVMEIKGEFPDINLRPTLLIMSGDKIIGNLRLHGPGPFVQQVSLKPLLLEHSGEYCTLEFISNTSFNPRKLGQSADFRNLSWKLLELTLVPS